MSTKTCPLCHTPGASINNCPLNTKSTNKDYSKHYYLKGGGLAAIKSGGAMSCRTKTSHKTSRKTSHKTSRKISRKTPRKTSRKTMSIEPYVEDIEKLTENNRNFRKVLYTTPTLQLVLMSLLPKEDVGLEIHRKTTQFFRIESGNATVFLNDEKYGSLGPGDVIVVPPNTKHNIINSSTTKRLQMYTLYSPPHHPPHRLQKYKPHESGIISQ